MVRRRRIEPAALPLALLPPPLPPPVLAVLEVRVVALGLVDQLLRRERPAARRGALFGGVGVGNDEHQHAVDDEPRAPSQDRQHHEGDTDESDVDVEVGCQPRTEAADHRAFADLVEPPSRALGVARFLASRGRAASRGGGVRVAGIDRSHLGEDAIDLAAGDDRLVRPEQAVALLGDGLLEIGEDLGTIRVVSEPDAGALEISDERVVAGFLDVIRAAVQVDGDHFLHA